MSLDFSHDAARRSWVDSANAPATDFPLQNLPLGIFSTPGDRTPRLGTAIGAEILDLHAAAVAGLLPRELAGDCQAPTLNPLLARDRSAWLALRTALSRLLGADTCGENDRRRAAGCLVSSATATLHLPAAVGDYTDFYASIDHAATVGSLFRPEQPLLPNYRWVPIGYHGRASSLRVSGTAVRRPQGQRPPARPGEPPVYAPTCRLDFELEAGFLLGPGNVLGEPVPITAAARCLRGLVLLNDWSARDLQAWEYQPLGPFLAKSFATTLSPWVVTMEALAPFRAPARPRGPGEPAPLPHLADPDDQAAGALDVTLEVLVASATMRAAGHAPHRAGRAPLRSLYWTPAQLVAHHTSNGCNLQPGDLLGSGTVSGPGPEERGCLLERAGPGGTPLVLPTGETRTFLADGDEVILRGHAERPGFRRIGLGECRAVVLPAATA